MQLPEGTHLTYNVYHEAWHWDMSRNHNDSPQIGVVATYPEGGSAWSFSVVDDRGSARLNMFYDGWRAFHDVPEFFAGLAELRDNTSLEQVRDLLDRLGAVDTTPRVRPEYLTREQQDAERLAQIEAREQADEDVPWLIDQVKQLRTQNMDDHLMHAGELRQMTRDRDRWKADYKALDVTVNQLRGGLPQCNGKCLRATDVLDDLSRVVGNPVARVHRSCPKHGDPEAVAWELDAALTESEAKVASLQAELANHRANYLDDGHATGCSPERHNSDPY